MPFGDTREAHRTCPSHLRPNTSRYGTAVALLLPLAVGGLIGQGSPLGIGVPVWIACCS
ncbi:hypothetical protein ACFWIJ_01715 [Streptomyces sp. NPDC127079]|uniref:hypothetical protein n=1 Tax=Streptomyces sp. NPDC127079 TaxID=3347132 RepID=UPI0036632D25